ncbi:DUF2789 domain-containing protein [Thalassotalea aquiviva]|uniref:DUF2789 domain-containing protein n=1 Tax=Thalassotalea aquiviva TaxID=3242415 RepID=UPI00352AAA04
MESFNHDLSDLFAQLGLSSNRNDIVEFIEQHRGIESSTRLCDAHFWSPSQRSFIKDAISQDSDWCEVVDTLDSLLR